MKRYWVDTVYNAGYTLDMYQLDAIHTAIYPKEKALEYCLLQLAAEAGECAGKLGKSIRKGEPFEVEDMVKELGDVLWYIANAAHTLDYNLSEVAKMNILKLRDRAERGVINGDGDNR